MMSRIWCPFCYSNNTLPIVCNNTIQPRDSKYYKDKCNMIRLSKNEAILSNWNLHYSKNYDNSIVKRKTYDRYCIDCNKPFYYISNMIVSDIILLTFIIETNNDRWKYELHFDEEKSYYNIDHNYITKSHEASLTPARKIKILDGINKSNFLKWNPMGDDNRLDYNIRWSVCAEFYDGQTYFRGGYDKYPNGWDTYIDPFIRVFKNDIFKKMKNKSL